MEMADAHVIIGPPGTGKTSTIAHQVERAIDAGYAPADIDIRSLTRAAAKVAAGRIDLPEGRIGTLHSAAFRALGLSRDMVVSSKNLHEFNDEHPGFAVSGAETDIDDSYPVERGVAGPGDMLRAVMDVQRAKMMPRDQWRDEVKPFADAWFDWLAQAGLVDFTGMLELALRDTYAMPGHPALMFFDEAQDFSALGFSLVKHWAQEAQKVLTVGDAAQCLYGWTGADPEELMAFAPKVHVLKQSYRLPRAVHSSATSIARAMLDRWKIKFEPRDADGLVWEHHARSTQPEEIIEYCHGVARDGRAAMILTSCSYMLGPTIAVLRKQGIPFSNPWRPTRGDWNPLRGVAPKVHEFLVGDQRNIRRMEWMKDLQASVLARGVKTQLLSKRAEVPTPASFTDWCSMFASEADAIKAIGERSLEWLVDSVEIKRHRTYSYAASVASCHGVAALQEPPRLHVGTVHSVKGSEADVVAVFPDLSVMGWEEMQFRDREAVDRVFYVAASRAREELILCSGNGIRMYQW